ncbi:hypothetical protein E8E13_008420 [Curvularia kusanoi]|uniref:C3H1-type domain-containing protein n=1 Tax=Curvularia kusanoi TaxID=90978 RepID=A0A9P4W8P7_CURKU|nr:hypothetical protein E8E13_008420 [Curvularia kusanoi]
MDQRSEPTIDDTFENEAEVIILQEQVGTLKEELKRTKRRLRDVKNNLKREEAAKAFCLDRAQEHEAEYRAHLELTDSNARDARIQHAVAIEVMTFRKDEFKRKLADMEVKYAKLEEENKFLGQRINTQNNTIRNFKLQSASSGNKRSHDESVCREIVETTKNTRAWAKKIKVEHVKQSQPQESIIPHQASACTGTNPTIVVSCTRCSAQGLQCDNYSTCEHCYATARSCKRPMCKRFEAGACLNGACAYAHEGDRFDKLIPFTRITPNTSATVRSPRKTKVVPRAIKKSFNEQRYTPLFDEIARRRKQGKAGDGDGDGDMPGVPTK